MDTIIAYDDLIWGREIDFPAGGKASYQSFLEQSYRVFRDADLPPLSFMADDLPTAIVEINAGRWIWRCLACNTGVVPARDNPYVICSVCGYGDWHRILWPENATAIEEELLRQPGYRSHGSPLRMWRPGWSMDYLRERTAKALAIIAKGESAPRALSIGLTRVWAVHEILTAGNMNTFLTDPINDLSGDNGIVEPRNAMGFNDAGVNDRYVLYTPGSAPITPSNGMQFYNSVTNYMQAHMDGDWHNWLKDSDIAARINQLELVRTLLLDNVRITGVSSSSAILIPNSQGWADAHWIQILGGGLADPSSIDSHDSVGDAFEVVSFMRRIDPQSAGDDITNSDHHVRLPEDVTGAVFIGRTADNALLIQRESGGPSNIDFSLLIWRFQVT